MEWRQIVGFYHVARLRSFTRAGEASFRTQSALSQQIAALEEELGSRLFERIGSRKLELTPAGVRFLEFAEAALKGYENLTDDLNELKGIRGGPLRVAAPFTTLYHLFPQKLKAYLEKFPEVEATLLDRPQASVADHVKSGEADFGLVLESLAPKDLAAIRWKRVETVLMIPRGHALAGSKRVSWKRLSGHPLILPPKELKSVGRRILEEEFQKRGLSCRIAMESSNVELSSLYVEMGFGVSLATVVKDVPSLERRNLEFLPMDHYFKPDHIAVIMRKGKTLASYRKAFLDILLRED